MNIKCCDKIVIEFENEGVSQYEEISFEVFETNTTGNNVESDESFVYYDIDTINMIGTLTLLSCINDSIYYNTLNEFFNEVNRLDIKNIVLDLRYNGGGNSKVIDEFLRHLSIEEINTYGKVVRKGTTLETTERQTIRNHQIKGDLYDGEIYVLTSNATFSSATIFAIMLRDNGLCKIVGEPSGNRPSSYGDVKLFVMPESGLIISTTYKAFWRPDSTLDDEEALWPDYFVDSDFAYNQVVELVMNND